MIPQPPPGGGAGFQDHQVLRAEQHRRQHADDIPGCFLFCAVSPDLPGPGAGKQHKPQCLAPLLGTHICFDLREIRPKTDHFRSFLGPEALAGAGIADGLQEVRFTLGIVAHDQIDTGIEIQTDLLIIAEIPQLDIIEVHGWSQGSSGP